MTRLDFRGGAAKCNATGSIAVDDMSVTLDGDTSGWPTGATGRPFMAIIDRGVAGKMEKVLCSALASGVLTIASRGYDGTSALTHDANATVEHGLGASVIDDLSDHAYNVDRDDHTQYARVDGTRAFTDADALTGSPVSIAAANADGTAVTLARSDHAHSIPDGFIDTDLLADNAVTTDKIVDGTIIETDLGDNAVTTAKIDDDAVTTAKIDDAAVTAAKLAAGVRQYGVYTTVLDGTGFATMNHLAPFTPSMMLLTPSIPNGGANQGYPVVTAITPTQFTIRYLNTAGNMAGVAVTGYFLALP